MAAEVFRYLLHEILPNHHIILATFFTIAFLYWLGTHNFSVLKTLNVPGPKPWPFIGNLPEVKNYGGLHLLQLEGMKKYGKVFSVCFGRKPSLIVADPEVVKQIMVKDFAKFRNRPALIPTHPPLDLNLFSAKDEQWKKIRNTLSPSFTGAHLKQMVPFMKEASDILVKKLESKADTDSAVDIQSWFSFFSLEVILSCAFGIASNAQMEPDSELVKSVHDIMKTNGLLKLSRVLPGADKVLRLLGCQNESQLLTKTARDVITKRRRTHGTFARKDALHLLLMAHEGNTAEGVKKLSDDEVLANVVFFLVAGHETTYSTLSAALYHLAMNPDIQERLHLEITQAMQSEPNRPLYDLLRNITYLDCVICETQRIMPVAFNPHREASESCTINGIHIPAGLEVICAVYALHHDPDAWPDPDTFDPERFRGPENETRHPFQFIPFGGGPRLCIGMRFALLEVKIALTDLLTKFKFVRCAETQVPLVLNPGITIRPRDGVHVKVKRR